MTRIPDVDVLRLCDQLQRRHPIDVAVLLAAQAQPQHTWEAVSAVPLGQRNRSVLELRCAQYGDELKAMVDCPQCHTRMVFSLSGAQLLAQSESQEDVMFVTVDEWRFRLPCSVDLARVAPLTDEPQRAALGLLRLCCESHPDCSDDELRAIMPRVALLMEQADPQADVRLELVCESCGHEWLAYFDAADFLQQELNVQSERVLDDIHLLATAYGWSESQVLALSAERRAAYRERVLR